MSVHWRLLDCSLPTTLDRQIHHHHHHITRPGHSVSDDSTMTAMATTTTIMEMMERWKRHGYYLEHVQAMRFPGSDCLPGMDCCEFG